MNKINEWKLNDGISIAEVDKFPETEYRTLWSENLGDDFPMLPWRANLSPDDVERVEELAKSQDLKHQLRLALLKEDRPIGWTYGWQDGLDSTVFYMGTSAVVPEFRRRGFYTELVKKVIEITKAKGFQSISSNHIMTNNPVIVAKMRLGFCISGFESNVNFGSLVKLTYHHSDLRRSAAKFRAGAVRETEVLNLLLNGEQ